MLLQRRFSAVLAASACLHRCQRLESGEADLAVGFTPNLGAGFYQQALFAQDFVCLAASAHPRIGMNALTWTQATSGCATPWRGCLRARGWMFEALK